MNDPYAAHIENSARDMVRMVVSWPGWAGEIDRIMADYRREAEKAAATPGTLPREAYFKAFSDTADRAEAILRHIATGGPDVLIRQYFDILPGERQAQFCAMALKAFKAAGADPEMVKDEAGQTFFLLNNPEALQHVPQEVREAAPKPVGELHRLH